MVNLNPRSTLFQAAQSLLMLPIRYMQSCGNDLIQRVQVYSRSFFTSAAQPSPLKRETILSRSNPFLHKKDSNTSIASTVTLNESDVEEEVAKANALPNIESMTLKHVGEAQLFTQEWKVQATTEKYPKVSFQTLNSHNLLPCYQLQLGDISYYFSKTFILDGNHLATLGFVEIEDKMYPRIFYQSNSQATWRLLPYGKKKVIVTPKSKDFVMGESSYYTKKIIYFGKGPHEGNTDLPIVVSCALNQLASKKLEQRASYEIHELVESMNTLEKNQPFRKLVQKRGSVQLLGNMKKYSKKGLQKIPKPPIPSKIHLPQPECLHPDFSQRIGLSFENKLYGKIKAHIFRSYNHELLYLFHETIHGKVYLASLEWVNSTITRYGVRNKAMELKNLNAPLLEYPMQIPDGFSPKRSKGAKESYYVSNWNYVREIPLIQMFYDFEKRRIPRGV